MNHSYRRITILLTLVAVFLAFAATSPAMASHHATPETIVTTAAAVDQYGHHYYVYYSCGYHGTRYYGCYSCPMQADAAVRYLQSLGYTAWAVCSYSG